jgi:uncharacterized membrane protein YadS
MRIKISTEDGWAVVLGVAIVALALPCAWGFDLLGWLAAARVWLEPGKAVGSVADSEVFRQVPGAVYVVLTYLFFVVLLGAGAWAQGFEVGRFLAAFSVLFAIAMACWLAGHYAYIAQTPNKLDEMKIGWSLGLTGEAGYLLALMAGLAIGNLAPHWAQWLKPATRPEWYIKTAIVLLGAALGIKAAEKMGLMSAILFRGLAAIIEAYLIYWALVYFIARKYFRFSREWAAPLASGISICGVSAAITTGAAIRARPIVPIMVSSLVVVFSVVELVVLPFAAQFFLWMEPLVAAAWMGLAVKTDGAAVASGAITEALILARAGNAGIHYKPGWMLTTTTTVKVFIDVFIGIWALVLACIWVYKIEPAKRSQLGADAGTDQEGNAAEPETRLPLAEIGRRFPKFVLGYFLLFLVLLFMALQWPQMRAGLGKVASEADACRSLLFALTFLSIGLGANVKQLWAEGIGRLALVYALSLFGFIIWIGLILSWLFFHGVYPPLAS